MRLKRIVIPKIDEENPALGSKRFDRRSQTPHIRAGACQFGPGLGLQEVWQGDRY
jgi:hypothetical protein